MSSNHPPRHFLFTYPRTASNLLLKNLSLEDQPAFLPCDKGGYFFIPTVPLRFETVGKHFDEWTSEEKETFLERHQSCFQALQKHVQNAEVQGKRVYVKEHVPWLIEPVAETKWLFGEESTNELSLVVEDFPGQTHSSGNETILPDGYLKSWLPTFLIRHPALVFPSSYRTGVDNEGAEAAKADPMHALEMTVHWSRTLYDWYAQQFESLKSTSRIDYRWPIILDADDIMLDSEIVLQYATVIGLDPSKLKFSWTPAHKEEVEKMHPVERRMRSTISSSSGIVEGKTSKNLDIDVEAKKWKMEFGEVEGKKIEEWVRAAMPDYKYMRSRRFGLKKYQ
ncbi:hypothetical protein G7Y89_g13230 [Cudoniella acicularis]|uniref:Uncharacterized protein n=1 Tax=Cudoniella acicularis TaxID=354080 RepID=A0A8H4RA12_9HELO|nr:hypothetical protein G7Y89_g13230 [Cudoniella acicularis]